MFQHFKVFIACTISALFFSHNATAKDCYEQSPNYGDAYFDLEETAKLSNEQAEKIKAVFEKLKGRWEGESITIDCWGPDDAAHTTSRKGNVKLKTTLASNSSLSISAQKHDVERRIKQSEIVSLLGNPQIFDFKFSQSNNDIIFSEKFRRRNYKPKEADKETKTVSIFNKIFFNKRTADKKPKQRTTSRLNEIIYEIKPGSGTFNLTRHFYTNGVYVGQEQWVMHKN